MAMTKAEVREAFREAMASNYADVPPKDELDHTFSPEFCAKMETLIADQKRGAWRMKSRQYKRTLVVAALLAAALLLVACTPGVRRAMARLAVTIYETFVDFTVDTNDGMLRSEIEKVYGFDSLPKGFELVSQIWENPYYVESVYENTGKEKIIIIQTVPRTSITTADIEKTTSYSKTIGESEVFFSETEDLRSATVLYDGYSLTTQYCGRIARNDFERMIIALLTNN